MTDFPARTAAFEQQVKEAWPFLPGEGTKLQKALSASNRGALMEGQDIYLGVCNLEHFLAEPGVTDFRYQTYFRFIPDDEVHLLVSIRDGIGAMRARLEVLAQQAKENGTKKINNNVRFFLAKDGQMYLDNAFRDVLPPLEELAPAIPIARLDYAIWSPGAEVKGLAATEFANFFAKTVGRQIAHPHTPWGLAGAMSIGGTFILPRVSSRAPAELSLEEIQEGIRARNGHYNDDIVRRFHTAMTFLPAKHFALLAGVSGSGKTSLVVRYAHTVHGIPEGEHADPLLFIIPVQPDWTDRSGLLGWYDGIARNYVVPRFLEALLVANANPLASVIVCLDELNLARVEYYLSDVLSAMESGQPISLHSHTGAIDGDNGWQVQPTIRIPSNLYLVGTINVDETTHRIADKVLDRATYIDTSRVDIPGFIDTLNSTHPALQPAIEACRGSLVALSSILAEYGQPFGYRTTEEVLRYHDRAVSLGGHPNHVLDELLVQKILTKLKGEQSLAPMLVKLGKEISGYSRCASLISRLSQDLEDFGSFQAVR